MIYDIMKIWRERMNHLMNEWINDKAVYRTAPATPGVLKMSKSNIKFQNVLKNNTAKRQCMTLGKGAKNQNVNFFQIGVNPSPPLKM